MRILFVAAMLAAALAVGCDGDDEPGPGDGDSQPQTSVPAAGGAEPSPGAADDGDALSVVEIAQLLGPSIVRVQTESATIDQFGRVVPGGGIGTGFIIDEQGHIVTNNHVIESAAESPDGAITVTLADQSVVPATLVGRDVATDIAVLDIEVEGLSAAEWGDAEELTIGEPVVAIGFALGLEGAPSVTAGVLSARDRTIEEPPYTIPEALQTDAGINPGNSGGPLVNDRGEVIGINTAIIRGAENIGFAISVGLAEDIVEQLIDEGSIERAYLGIGAADVTPAIVQNLDLAVEDGIIVTLVEPGSPADEAGIRANDVIVSLDGQTVSNSGDLLSILADVPPGETVTMRFFREGQEQESAVTPTQRPSE
jgi:serine protease Do